MLMLIPLGTLGTEKESVLNVRSAAEVANGIGIDMTFLPLYSIFSTTLPPRLSARYEERIRFYLDTLYLFHQQTFLRTVQAEF